MMISISDHKAVKNCDKTCMQQPQLWLRSDVLFKATLPIIPGISFKITHLKKLISYSKQKNEFPLLSFVTWNHIYCYKMGHSNSSYAWIYFSTFLTLCDNLSPLFHGYLIENRENKSYVSVIAFAIFLLLQNKPDMRKSQVEESYPELSTETSRNASGGCRFVEEVEARILCCVRQRANEMVSLLECAEISGCSASSSMLLPSLPRLVAASLRILDLFLEGLAQHNHNTGTELHIDHRPVLRFSDIADRMWPECQQLSGLKVASFIKAHICNNTYLRPQPNRLRLSWPVFTSNRGGRTARLVACPISYNEISGQDRTVLALDFVKTAVAKNSSSMHLANVIVENSRGCSFYFLNALNNASIYNCRQCVVVLGAVRGVVKMQQCEECTLISIAKRVIISDTKDTRLYLKTLLEPLLMGVRNENVLMAPYNSNYLLLEQHVIESQLASLLHSTTPDLWDCPIAVETGNKLHSWSKLAPSHFHYFNIPFREMRCTEFILSPLPREYELALQSRLKAILKLDLNHTEGDGKEENFRIIEKEFKKWLCETGKQEQISQLHKLIKTCTRPVN